MSSATVSLGQRWEQADFGSASAPTYLFPDAEIRSNILVMKLFCVLICLPLLAACMRHPGRTVVLVTPATDLATLPVKDAVWELTAGTYRQSWNLAGLDQVTLLPAADAGDAEVVFWRAGIHLTGCTAVMLSRLHFRQTPKTALSIEASSQVTVQGCSFTACGTLGGTVTLWLGKGTSACIVEDCDFDTAGLYVERHTKPSHVHDIAIMCAQDDCVRHHFVGNRISDYGYGLQLGVNGTCRVEGRHEVLNNEIHHPMVDGIHVKAARCVVRGNRVVGGKQYGMSARAGFATRFEGNTIIDCRIGIRVLGRDHVVMANRIERARRAAILLRAAKDNGDGFAAANTVVAGNVMIDCGGDPLDPYPEPAAGIVFGNDLVQRLGSNVVIGEGRPTLTITGDRE